MKKALLILICLVGLCSFSSNAQTQWYNSQSYAYKSTDYYGNWSSWSSWVDCNVNIKFNLSSDMIVIYSSKKQIYKITRFNGTKYDNDGGQQAYFKAIDQDGDRCTIRLRIESNGNSQIYVEFSNIMGVYNVRRTS